MSQFVEFESKAANPDTETVFDISSEELLTKKDLVQLIDVRRPDEFEGELGHIPGAKLIVLDYLPQKINEIDKEKTTVFICRSGKRSANATKFAQEQGFTSVYNLKGGMLLWNENKLPTEK